jgi:hypothetical protein
MRSAKNFIVSTSSASLTVTMSSTSRRMTSKLCSPRCCVWRRRRWFSARRCARWRRLRSDCWPSLPASGSTPIHLAWRATARACRQRAAGQQAAAAQRHQQRVELADFLEQLLGRRALAGDHVRWS